MASKRKAGIKHVLELLENDSDDSDFEKEFSDSESEEDLIGEDDHYFESKQEWSSSDENGECDAGDCGETVILAKSGLDWKETPFRANMRHDIENLWHSNGTEMDLLRSVKSSKRFKFWVCQMRFDDSAKRCNRPLGCYSRHF